MESKLVKFILDVLPWANFPRYVWRGKLIIFVSLNFLVEDGEGLMLALEGLEKFQVQNFRTSCWMLKCPPLPPHELVTNNPTDLAVPPKNIWKKTSKRFYFIWVKRWHPILYLNAIKYILLNLTECKQATHILFFRISTDLTKKKKKKFQITYNGSR